MPTPKDIEAEKIRLYETLGVRDDLDDAEATVLLQWAERRIDQLAALEGDFEQQNRFMRALLARIDRFVGQRQYMDDTAHAEGIAALMKALPIAGFHRITEEALLAALPPDRANMAANLNAILALLATDGGPAAEAPAPPTEAEPGPPADAPLAADAPTEAEPDPPAENTSFFGRLFNSLRRSDDSQPG